MQDLWQHKMVASILSWIYLQDFIQKEYQKICKWRQQARENEKEIWNSSIANLKKGWYAFKSVQPIHAFFYR